MEKKRARQKAHTHVPRSAGPMHRKAVFFCVSRTLPQFRKTASIRFLSNPSPMTMSTSCPAGMGGRGQAVGGGIQLHPAGGILHKTLDPQHPAAGGIREQAGNACFQLLPGQAQLEEIRRTECIVRIKAELFAVGMLITAGIQRRKIRILQVSPVLDQKIFFSVRVRLHLQAARARFRWSMALSRWAWVAS